MSDSVLCTVHSCHDFKAVAILLVNTSLFFFFYVLSPLWELKVFNNNQFCSTTCLRTKTPAHNNKMRVKTRVPTPTIKNTKIRPCRIFQARLEHFSAAFEKFSNFNTWPFQHNCAVDISAVRIIMTCSEGCAAAIWWLQKVPQRIPLYSIVGVQVERQIYIKDEYNR